MTIQHLFLRLLIFLVNWELRNFTERLSELRLIYRSIGSCYTRPHKPCTFLVDQNAFSTPCSCGAPHLAWRSPGGYLDVLSNALIGLVVTSLLFSLKKPTSPVKERDKIRITKSSASQFCFPPDFSADPQHEMHCWIPGITPCTLPRRSFKRGNSCRRAPPFIRRPQFPQPSKTPTTFHWVLFCYD